ncbi:hypothetical protein AB0L26_26005 [Streptomyces nondiastaticus]|uniref:hypothetical protein n=1 Tax=Streptomyces nondiastaticus TaxID=3154512 RepID=UPI00342AE24B
MTQYARSGQGTLLDYRYKTVPTTVNVSAGDDVQRVRLEVTVSGRAGAPAQCEWVRITLPHGAEPEDLTLTDPKDLWTSAEGGDLPAHGNGWEGDPQDVEDGRIVVPFTPRRKPVLFNGTFSVTLVVSYIVVNEARGIAEIGVTERTRPNGQGSYENRPAAPFVVKKHTPGFFVDNFHPSHASVGNGETVTLSWDGSRGPTYELYWGEDGYEDVTNHGGSWISPPLENTTGFMLVATDAADGSAPLVHAMTTAVTVERPHLVVGNLEVNGVTRLQGDRQRLTVLPAAGAAQYYRAGTDGTLLGYLQAASGAAGSTLAATVYRAGANEYTMRFTSVNPSGTPPKETPVSLPVPEGAEVLLFFGGQPGDTLDLVWLPQGTGAFQVIDR